MKQKKRRTLKTLLVFALSLVMLVGTNLTAHAATTSISRPNTTANYKTNVKLTYSQSEFKKLKGTTGKMVASFTDGTKAQVNIKYYADKVQITSVKVTGHTNIWKVNCTSSNGTRTIDTSKTLSPSTSVRQDSIKVNTSGNVVLNFQFTLPR